MTISKIAFLDRDGTIIEDGNYLSDPKDIKPMPGVFQALALLQEKGYKLVVVTNQSGFARGFFTQEQYDAVTTRLVEVFASRNIVFEAVLHCPHHPDDNCLCRKPNTGMLLSGAAMVGAELRDCIMIGNWATDIEAGRKAGCRTFWIGPNNNWTDFRYWLTGLDKSVIL